MALDDFNGTRSIIIDRINQTFQTPATANGVLVIGTARKGPKNQIIRAQDEDVEEIFGSAPNDPSFDTSAVRAYYEVSRPTANGVDAFIMRVGDATKATLNLWESQGLGGTGFGGPGTGDFSFTEDTVNNELTFALINEALVEGSEANNGRIEVTDEDGIPSSITFETPDGIRKTYALDPFGSNPNALSNVREIAQTFNADEDWSKWYVTRYPVLRQSELEVTVQVDANGGRYIEIDGGTQSYGDKLDTLEEVAIRETDATDDVPFGVTSFGLSSVPDKDDNDTTVTIDQFIRTVEDERAFVVEAPQVGQSVFSSNLLLGQANARWDGNIGFVYETDENDDNFDNFQLEIVKPNGNRILVPKLAPDTSTIYSVNASGQLNVDLTNFATQTSFQLGDIFVATYNYGAFYKEANLRSQLETGNEFSYFVKGPEIIFGASTTLQVQVVYETKRVFDPADINVTDTQNIIVYFINPLTRPDVGDTVLMTYSYLPELPASSSEILDKPDTTSVVQPSGFRGGDDGRLVGKVRYKELVSEALDLIELYPFKQIFIGGAYLDDAVEGYDDETGLPAVIPVNWGGMLIPKLARRSYLVKEVVCNIPVRAPEQFTPEAQNDWFDRLLNNDNNDVARGANQIDALLGPDSFRLNILAGAPIVAVSQLLGGTQYVGNPAAIYTGMRQDLPVEESHTNALIAPFVLDLGVKTLNAEVIGNMNAKKYTFMTIDAAGNLLIADAPTASIRGSNFDRQFVVDATYAAIEIARVVSGRFIGLPRSPENVLAMKNKVNRELQYLVPRVFQNIQANVIDVPEGSITGRTKLGLSMVTSREIRRVDIETRITLV